jgi:hypothetical protein
VDKEKRVAATFARFSLHCAAVAIATTAAVLAVVVACLGIGAGIAVACIGAGAVSVAMRP